jgi:HEXXH motif-containing protein
MALIDAGNPALGAEIHALVQEIVLAAGSDDPEAVQFDGVSSFLLWGGVVLNARSYASPIAMVQALAHESGHNLLFGLCADGPLHDNDDAERFASPLRSDPRPIDGIVHAAYVTARMHQAVQRLLDAGILSPIDAAEAAEAARDNARRFAAGIETVDRHARLTPLGVAIMGDARRYMAAWC